MLEAFKDSTLFSVLLVVVMVMIPILWLKQFANQFSTQHNSPEAMSMDDIKEQFIWALQHLLILTDGQHTASDGSARAIQILAACRQTGGMYRQQFSSMISTNEATRLDDLLNLLDATLTAMQSENLPFNMASEHWQSLHNQAVVVFPQLQSD
jgi:hypothetical protein